MSELKVHRFITTDELFPEANAGALYYGKDDADKVIAEKDEEIAELQKQVHDYARGLYVIQAKAEREARHQKYKRCLAMADWCKSEYEHRKSLSDQEQWCDDG